MLNYLKIKCVSLAEEAKLIRKDENKRIRFAANARRSTKNFDYASYHETVYNGLRHHRTTVVRSEARSAHLAYSFLRGHAYQDIEAFCLSDPDFRRIQDLVKRYGCDMNAVSKVEDFDTWRDLARAYIREARQAMKDKAKARAETWVGHRVKEV